MFDTLLDRLSLAGAANGTAGDRRATGHRESVAWAAMLEVDGQLHPIEVSNISASGLMAGIDAELTAGARVEVRLGDAARLAGEVRWYNEGRFGLRFEDPVRLDPALLARFRDACVEQAKTLSRWMV